jgi:hypothetical protein
VEESKRVGEEMRGVSREFLLGLLKAALPPHQISLRKVRMVLKLAVASGVDPSELYRAAIEGRPEDWDVPPALDVAVSREVENSPPLESTAQVARVKEGLRSTSA